MVVVGGGAPTDYSVTPNLSRGWVGLWQYVNLSCICFLLHLLISPSHPILQTEGKYLQNNYLCRECICILYLRERERWLVHNPERWLSKIEYIMFSNFIICLTQLFQLELKLAGEKKWENGKQFLLIYQHDYLNIIQ